MATKRKRFAVIETSLMREPWPHRTKLALVMLTLHMTDRWAGEGLTAEQGARCVLTAGDALNVTGAQSLEAARDVLRDLSAFVTIRITERDEWTEVHWPKLPETQGWPKVDKCSAAAATRWNRSGHGARNPSRSKPATYPSAPAPAPASAIREESDAEPSDTRVKKPRRERPPVPEDAAKFAEDFRDALVQIHPGTKPPTPAAFESWRQAARLLLHTDRRPLAEAAALASWLFSDPGADAAFWRSNVLSLPTFREKYDRLLVKQQANRTEVKRGSNQRSGLLAWAHG